MMSHINDCIFNALRTQGYQGARNEMEVDWLQAGGAISNDIDTAWREFLIASGAVPGAVNDMMFEWLGSLGHVGSLNDRLWEFWCIGGGVIGPGVTRAWITDDERLVVKVQFNGAPAGSLNTGVTFTVNGSAPQTFDRATDVGNNQVHYAVNESKWAAGDVVRWIYTPGNITVGGEVLPAQDKLVDNQIIGAPVILSIRSFENRIQNGNTVIRQPVIEVTYDKMCDIVDASGITIKVQGAAQTVGFLGGSGTTKHQFNVSRAIFRHAVTFEYDQTLGNITGTTSGDPLESFPETQVSNEAEAFTVWDWNPGATNGFDTDTKWDGDETRFDDAGA